MTLSSNLIGALVGQRYSQRYLGSFASGPRGRRANNCFGWFATCDCRWGFQSSVHNAGLLGAVGFRTCIAASVATRIGCCNTQRLYQPPVQSFTRNKFSWRSTYAASRMAHCDERLGRQHCNRHRRAKRGTPSKIDRLRYVSKTARLLCAGLWQASCPYSRWTNRALSSGISGNTEESRGHCEAGRPRGSACAHRASLENLCCSNQCSAKGPNTDLLQRAKHRARSRDGKSISGRSSPPGSSPKLRVEINGLYRASKGHGRKSAESLDIKRLLRSSPIAHVCSRRLAVGPKATVTNP